MVSTVINAGNSPFTTRLDMSGTDDLTVNSTGVMSVNANNQTVRFNALTTGALVTNHGTLENTAVGGRAIRFESSIGATLTATIANTSTIQSDDDAVQIQAGTLTSGTLTITNNGGTIQSTVGQALDLAGGTGAFQAFVTNSSDILAQLSDAIRFGGVGSLTNSGNINGGSNVATYDEGDGVQFEDNATGTVLNQIGGQILGDRHGINGGLNSFVTVTNGATLDLSTIIKGRNGSGVGLDGNGSVINRGTITGAFNTDGNATDVHGNQIGQPNGGVLDLVPDGDGDGIDIDGQATVENFGTIEGTGAGGTGSDGRANTSEGIAAGGGTFTNHLGGIIQGLGLGMLIDDSSTGPAPFLSTIVNDGTITGTNSYGIRLISTHADTITNRGTITGHGVGNTAIAFGNGNNTLFVGTGSVINGLTDGEGGTNKLDYSAFVGAVTVNLLAGTATGTGGVAHFQNVLGSAGFDTITGDNFANTLHGNGGNDTVNGLGGNDLLFGENGNDRLVGGIGNDTLSAAAGNDTLTGDAGNDRLSGGIGNDKLGGGIGNDTLTGDAGNDTLSGDAGNDRLSGGLGIDKLAGGAGNDTLNGDAGNDRLNGDAGNDTLNGDRGNDIITGGAGKDTSTGGHGDGVFRFTKPSDSPRGGGADVITDFDRHGNDRIDLRAVFAGTLDYISGGAFNHAGQVRINDVAGPDVIVEVNLNASLAPEMQIRLSHTTFASMSSSDFLL